MLRVHTASFTRIRSNLQEFVKIAKVEIAKDGCSIQNGRLPDEFSFGSQEILCRSGYDANVYQCLYKYMKGVAKALGGAGEPFCPCHPQNS